MTYNYTDTERRHLREMVIFIRQLSVLKVYDGFLYLDEISDGAKDEMNKELKEALDVLEKEKEISKETLFEAIENSLG